MSNLKESCRPTYSLSLFYDIFVENQRIEMIVQKLPNANFIFPFKEQNIINPKGLLEQEIKGINRARD